MAPMPTPHTTTLACLAAIALALAASGCGEKAEPQLATTATEPQFEITGAWEGRLTQQGMKPFRVEARIRSLARSKQNTVRYTGALECAGTWDYLGASDTAYRFRERIDKGASMKCKGTGTVALTPLSDDRVDYRFVGGGVVSTGVLDRSSG